MNETDYKIIDSAGGIVVNNKNQVVLVLMKDVDAWDFPKGGIEKGEDIIDAAKREIYEEAGIKKLTLIKTLPNYKRRAANDNPVIIDTYMFLFKSEQEHIHPTAKDIVKAKWVNKSNMVENLSLLEAKNYFRNIENEI